MQTCKRGQGNITEYKERPVISATWGVPPPHKKALNESLV